MVELLVAFPSTLPVHCPSHKFGKNLFEVMQCAPLLTQVERVKSFIIVSLSDCFLFYHYVSVFSVFYKIFLKTNEHQHNVVSWPQNRTENGSVTNSLKEININRVLLHVAAGFLCCWIPMWALTLWFRFSFETCARIAVLLATFLYYFSAFRKQFQNLLVVTVKRQEICEM